MAGAGRVRDGSGKCPPHASSLQIDIIDRNGIVRPGPTAGSQSSTKGSVASAGSVSAALGVYYQVYDNFQVSVPVIVNGNPTGAFETRSAGGASNLGVEGEVAVDVPDWPNVFGNFGFIDGGIDDDPANGTFAGAISLGAWAASVTPVTVRVSFSARGAANSAKILRPSPSMPRLPTIH